MAAVYRHRLHAATRRKTPVGIWLAGLARQRCPPSRSTHGVWTPRGCYSEPRLSSHRDGPRISPRLARRDPSACRTRSQSSSARPSILRRCTRSGVERPHPEVSRQHGHRRACLNRRRDRKQLHPTELDVFPRDQRRLRAFEVDVAVSHDGGCLIHTKSWCDSLACEADRRVREGGAFRVGKEPRDRRRRGPGD